MTSRPMTRPLALMLAGVLLSGLALGTAETAAAQNQSYHATNDAYHPPAAYPNSAGAPPANDAYVPPSAQPTTTYGAGGYGGTGYGNNAPPPSDPGYGAPYTPPPEETVSPPPVTAEEYEQSTGRTAGGNGFSQNEIILNGHKFFGSISQGLASAVEYAFKSQGQPNGYILGEDAGGAFILGLRYGEGTLYTKDAGNHKVFWQGPSVGYDAGAEGNKTMVLVYNLSDPSDIYNRFGGVQGSAYLVGGVSVQFQKYGDVTLGVIRSGVGLRLGANIGYSKYTRTPTWNPL